VWQPLSSKITDHISEQNQLLLIISPFIKVDALKSLLENTKYASDLKVVVRWRPEDIISQVSDLEIYPLLCREKIPLYFNHRIHLKLYLLGANEAFHTSGNLTSKGLGLCEGCNIEVGAFVPITNHDWVKLYEIIESSRIVNDDVFEAYVKYYHDNKKLMQDAPKLILPQDFGKEFSLSSLPASQNPKELWEYYSSGNKDSYGAEFTRKYVHDLIAFQMPEGLGKEDFFINLEKRIKQSRFIQSIVGLIQEKKSCRFGEVNSWIHAHCSDVPLPYRWEIKANTNTLYDWLSFFYKEITWDRPNYSQVIYWKQKTNG